MKKPLVTSLLTALLSLALVVPHARADDPLPAGQPFMLATAGTGGTYYIIGGAIADVMRKHANTRVTPLTTNGSMENCRLVFGRRAGVGFSTPDLAHYAYNGLEMFRGQKLDNLRYVAGGHFSHSQVVVPQDSPITRLTDLKGKRVAVGAQGSAVLSWSMDVLAIAGLTLEDISPYYLSLGEMTDALKDGTVDAGIYGAGIPTSSVTNVFAEKAMRLVPIPKEETARWLAGQGPEKNALIATYDIPAGTYRNQDESVPTISFRACLVASSSTPEESVYNLLKTISDFQDELVKVHPSGKEYALENLQAGATIPLHPGAERFFREKGAKVAARQ